MKKLLTIAFMLTGILFGSCTNNEEEAGEQLGSIYGIVTELGTAEPMKAIGIELYIDDYWENYPLLMKTVTFDDGHFEFKDLNPKKYQVKVVADGYEQTEKGYVTVEAGRQARIDLQVKRKETYMAVYTSDATVIGNKVMLNGRYTYNDWQVSNPSEVGFVYSTQNNPKNGGITVTCNDVDNTTKTFSKTIEDLAMGTYYVQAYAKNTIGVEYGAVYSFNITGAPSVSTLAASNISASDLSELTATLNGHIDYVGAPAYTERGFVYSYSFANPTVEDPESATTKKRVSGSSEDFSANVAGLTKNKTYYVRAYVSNSKGTWYGESISFSTDLTPYVVIEGLAVQKQDLGSAGYGAARNMCEGSRVGGFSDWRLPTTAELAILYTHRTEIGGFKSEKYWADNPTYDSRYYYYYNFSNGIEGKIYYSDYGYSDRNYYVRAVRTVE